MTRKANKELIFYGAPAKYEAVQQAVLDLSATAARSTFTYRLNKDEFTWACQGGFEQIASVLGDNVAAFNVAATPKCITINGSKDQYQQARSILQTEGPSMGLDKLTSEPPQHEAECSICWTPAEDPVTLVRCHPLLSTPSRQSTHARPSKLDSSHQFNRVRPLTYIHPRALICVRHSLLEYANPLCTRSVGTCTAPSAWKIFAELPPLTSPTSRSHAKVHMTLAGESYRKLHPTRITHDILTP